MSYHTDDSRYDSSLHESPQVIRSPTSFDSSQIADIYGTFAANWEIGGTDYQLVTAPHDGRFAFPNYDERVPMAAAARYDRRNRGGGTAPESYWKNGNPVDHEIHFNGNTLMVPVLAPIREETTIKQTILLKTLEAAKNLRSETNKYDLLRHIFKNTCPEVTQAVSRATENLKQFDSNIYEFYNLALVDRNVNEIDIGPGPGIPNAARENAFLFKLTLKMIPRNCAEVEDIGVKASKFPLPSNKTVYLDVPKTQGMLLNAITRQMITNPNEHKAILQHVASPISFMTTGRYTGREPDTNAFKHWFADQVSKTEFNAQGQALQKAYVGALLGMNTPNQRLLEIKMTRWEPETRRYVHDSVQTVFNNYSNVLNAFDNEDNPAPADLCDLASTFHRTFHHTLKRKTLKLLETANDMSYNANFSRFCRLRDAAIEVEADENELAIRFAENSRSSTRRQTTRAEYATTGRAFPMFQNPEVPEEQPRYLTQATTYAKYTGEPKNQYVQDGIGGQVSVPLEAFLSTHVDAFTFIGQMICMSSAETALREASGQKFPLECWGCKAQGHSFRDCPNKHKKEVRDNFFLKLAEMKKQRAERKSGPKRDYDQYKASGYMTKTIFDTLETINSDETDKSDRPLLLVNLMHEIKAHVGETYIAASESSRATKKIRQEGQEFYRTFVQVPMPRSFSAIQAAEEQLEFSINSMLFFLHLPIGMHEGKGTGINLKGLYDTGGCCNMGKKDYHLRIAEKCGHLVKQVVSLRESTHNTISIGGIKDSVEIDTLIEYYLPFTYGDGEHCTLMIGLTDDLPLNTLYGLPFILKAKIIPDYERQAAVSQYFKAEFPLIMETPQLMPLEHIERNKATKQVLFTEGSKQADS